MKTSTQVRRNRSAKPAALQAAKQPAARPEKDRALLKEVVSFPRDVKMRIALAALASPAVRPVVQEWLSSMPDDVLLNLVGAVSCNARSPKQSGRDSMMEWVCIRTEALPESQTAGEKTPTFADSDDFHLLIIGDTQRDPVTGLWAAPDGRLFLWDQPEANHAARGAGG